MLFELFVFVGIVLTIFVIGHYLSSFSEDEWVKWVEETYEDNVW